MIIRVMMSCQSIHGGVRLPAKLLKRPAATALPPEATSLRQCPVAAMALVSGGGRGGQRRWPSVQECGRAGGARQQGGARRALRGDEESSHCLTSHHFASESRRR